MLGQSVPARQTKAPEIVQGPLNEARVEHNTSSDAEIPGNCRSNCTFAQAPIVPSIPVVITKIANFIFVASQLSFIAARLFRHQGLMRYPIDLDGSDTDERVPRHLREVLVVPNGNCQYLHSTLIAL